MTDNNPAVQLDVWIDCDAGVDDAQGLLLALSYPEVNIVGISCVHGNVGLDLVVQNVARILTLCGREDIPIYKGCEEPLIGEPIVADYFHGMDGLGDAPEVFPAVSQLTKVASEGHGCLKLVEASQQYEGKLVLLALGPLTNIAMACKLDTHFPGRCKAIYAMGSAEAVGNVSPSAEFNFFCDPEAAHLVLRRFSNTTILSWECTERHCLPWGWFDKWVGKNTKKARFMAGIIKTIADRCKDQQPDLGFVCCDAVAVAVALRPDIVLSCKHVYCDVELRGELTRGMSIYDWNARLVKKANVSLIRSLDMDRFLAMMERSTD